MKKILILILPFLLRSMTLPAEEGMWIPLLLEQLNIKKMQDLGLRLSAEDIYSVNRSSLKDAIVQFGGGCTAGIVSDQGLILTNHHCGLGAIQRLSSMEHDYLADGFWARSFAEELPCPGTTVTLLIRIEEVTDSVLQGVTSAMNQFQRGQIIRQNIDRIEKQRASGSRYEAKIRPFYYGNQYYLFIQEVFRDIRLVGAPPSSIGKFGGDTDNWMWPRHTGDFSVFRIYAGKNNEAAPYSVDNVPYKPKAVLPVSLQGYQKEDFTFVFGYPGTTREYLPACWVDLVANKENPIRIGLRQKRIDIMDAAMEKDRKVRIQYTAKVNGISNGWKKMIGESKGIRRIDAVTKKRETDRLFMEWVGASSDRQDRYGNLIPAYEEVCREYLPWDLSNIFLTEAGMGIEVVRFAAGFRELYTTATAKSVDSQATQKIIENLKRFAADFYRNWQPAVDQQVMTAMIDEMQSNMDPRFQPAVLGVIRDKYGLSSERYAAEVFGTSVFTDSVRLFALLREWKSSQVRKLGKDPVFRLMQGIYETQEKNVLPGLMRRQMQADSLQRLFMAGQMEMRNGSPVYPDANGTLRISYGKVDDYSPADAVRYNYFTTLEGVMQKEDTAVYDYGVDPALKRLYHNHDFGGYADRDGRMHIAFIASNHTTGGNSGSPVLNASGQLIGLNFDRNWEGTLSDLMYDPSQCRNIILDIRYCLFVIDKVYGNRRLIGELQLVN